MRIPRSLVLAGVMLAAAMAAQQKDEFRWQGRLAAGKSIEVKGVNGPIRAQAASGDQAEVVATKTAKSSDPKQVKIEVVEHAGGVTICAVYPSSDSRPNECKPGSGGRNSVRDNDVNVEFAVRVPAGVRFLGRTVNGSVEATALKSEIEAHSVNGNVKVSTGAHATAQTVNGSITASLGKADWSGALEFKTVNGAITIELPDGAGAEVSASAVNGAMETDFPLTIQGRWGPKKLSGTIGGGGRQLNLKTVNGSIRLRRGGVV